jgi:hypothetical protein
VNTGKNIHHWLFLCVLCVLRGGESIAIAQAPKNDPIAASRDVDVTASFDRSAMWVADRITYAVVLTCRRGVDIVTDDLARDKVRLDGLDLVGVDSSREDRGEGVTTYRYAYHLTSYKVDQPTQKFGEMRVRYYVKRPGQRVEDVAPAGDVVVPGASLAVRSTLPDEAQTAVFRDARSAQQRSALFAVLQPVGIGLVVVSIVPAALWIALIVTRARTRATHRSARQVRHEERSTLDALKTVDLATESGRREAYDRVNTLVRMHLRDACGVPVDGLTAAEVGPALTARGARAPAELVGSILTACEQARYGANGALSAQACRDTIEQAEQVLAVR